MGTTTLQNLFSVLDPQKSFNWEISIPNIPGVNDSRQLTYKAISTTIPGSSVAQIKLEAHGMAVHFSGRRTWQGTWNVTIVEDRQNNTRDSIWNWFELVRSWDNNTGAYKSQYAVPAELVLLDDSNNVQRTIKLVNIWPTQLSEPAADQSDEIIRYDITFSYDYTQEFVAGAA